MTDRRAPSAAEPAVAFVVVVGDADERAVAAAIATATAVSASPVLAVASRETPLPPDVIVVTPPGAARAAGRRDHEDAGASALRHGLVRLANARVTGALISTTAPDLAAPAERLRAVLDAARATGAPLVVALHAGVRVGPVYAARDAWREIVTHPAGLPGVLAATGRAVLEVDVSA